MDVEHPDIRRAKWDETAQKSRKSAWLLQLFRVAGLGQQASLSALNRALRRGVLSWFVLAVIGSARPSFWLHIL